MPRFSLNIIGASELQRRAATILKEVARSDKESFILTHNEPQAVIMSVGRYEELRAIEELQLIPHRKTSPQRIKESFAKTGLYSPNFLTDLEDGLKKSTLYLK